MWCCQGDAELVCTTETFLCVLCSGLHIASTSFTCGSCLRRDHSFFFTEKRKFQSLLRKHILTCRRFKALNQFSERLWVWRYDGMESLNLKKKPKKPNSCSTSDYTDAIAKAEHWVMKKIMLNSIETPETWLGNQARLRDTMAVGNNGVCHAESLCKLQWC